MYQIKKLCSDSSPILSPVLLFFLPSLSPFLPPFFQFSLHFLNSAEGPMPDHK